LLRLSQKKKRYGFILIISIIYVCFVKIPLKIENDTTKI
jgi:hypothetical protein